MRISRRYAFGYGPLESLATVCLGIAVVGVLSGLASAAEQPAPAPGTAAASATPAEKTPAKPVPPAEGEAAPPTQSVAAPRSYWRMEVDEKLRLERSKITGLLRDGNIPPDRQAAFEDYYRKYALARWTWPERLPEIEKKEYHLPDCRRDFRNELKYARGTPAHDQLVDLALEVFTTIAKEDAHPAARFNAMLAIGELNEQESMSATQMPVPLSKALPVLLAALTDANQIDAVRLAALLGIYRHAVLRIADAQFRDNQVRQVSPAIRELAASKAEGQSAEGHAWMRARAMDILAVFGNLGPQNAVALALAAVVADSNDQLLARTAAARALGRLNYPANHGLDVGQLASALGQLASDVCVAELARMEREDKEKQRKQRRPLRPGMGPMGGMGMMMGSGYDTYEGGPGMGSEESYGGDEAEGEEEEGYMDEYMDRMMPGGMGPYGLRGREKEEKKEGETERNRRRLKAYLNAVLIGLTGTEGKSWNGSQPLPPAGVGSLAPAPPERDLVAGILAQVVSLFKLCDEKELDREEFRSRLEEELSGLRDALHKGATPAVAQPTVPGQPAGAAKPEPASEPADEFAPPAENP